MESTPTEAGPELPPEFDNINQESQDAEKVAGFVANKEQSELKSSISKKGGNSYYYAHNYEGQNFDDEQAKKVYGDGIIHGGAPILVAKRDEAKEAKAVEDAKKVPKQKIKTFAWNDEDKKVKIYIDLAQFDTPITKDMVEIKFEEFKVDILVVDETGLNNILELSPLYEKVEVDRCSWRINEKRITITLKKWLETKWYTLTKGGNNSGDADDKKSKA